MHLDRANLVRRMLGTATQLFLDDADPVSVHCLSASAIEHVEFLAKQTAGDAFCDHIFSTIPDMTERELKRLRNKYWRVIKHSHDTKRIPFDVEGELSDFSDEQNDAILFAAWYDYMKCGYQIPVAAQVFQLWFFRVYPNTLDTRRDFELAEFDGLDQVSRSQQKKSLRAAVETAKQWREIMNHPRTDCRELILGNFD